MKGKRKLSGVLLIITALIIMQLPVSEADAATSASDFKMEGTTLVKYRGTDKTVSIPDTVEVIGESAFEDNDKIELVVIPKSVKKIEAYAFWSCDRLDEVVLGRGLTAVDDYAFTSCKGLKQMTIPSNVRYIGIQAFADCVNMKDIKIPPEVTDIHESAFDGCANLVIHCEEGTYADKYAEAFYEKQQEMPEYEDVPDYSGTDTSDDNENSENDGNLGADGSTDGSVEIPEENGSVLGTTQIVGNHAVVFIDNTSPVVHDGAAVGGGNEANQNDIAQNEFMNSIASEDGKLPKYTIVDGKIVADQAYYRNKNLSGVTLPQGIEEIGQFAFARSSATDIVIPEGTTKVGYGAFYHCDNLTNVTLPSTIENVEPKAFTYSKWVDDFLQNGSQDFLISGNVLVAYRGVGGTVTIPEGVEVIAGEAFLGNTEITDIIFPKTLCVIGEGAFEGCINLKSAEIYSQVEKIKDRAFAGCALTELVLPASVGEVGLNAFDEDVTVTYAGGQTPAVTHELSAERLSNEKYRNVSDDTQPPGVTVVGMDLAVAELEGAKRSYTLSVETAEDASAMQKAYVRCYQEALSAGAMIYDLKLTDNSGIAITKLGKQSLTVTLPLPEQFAQENVKVITLDRNGQLEAVRAERISLDGVDAVRFRTTHLTLFGVYGDGSALNQEAVNEVSVTMQDMSAAPKDTESQTAGGYMNLLKWSFAGILLLWGSVITFGRKKYGMQNR